ncbi:MAG: hypothetical protein KFB97_11615 [Cyanobium sp. M30B3]|nr:MAG: hypothetical protein KFB97_11615 [Cyanobium sp. M30B3]
MASIISLASAEKASAQIFLNPAQQQMTRSRVSIDMGNGLRCTSDGGSVPTLSLSVGAYPDQWGSNSIIVERSVANQSSLLGLVSLHVPLGGTSQSFDCNALLKDAQLRARLDNLRELLDENLISESQYRDIVLRLYNPILEEKNLLKEAATTERPGSVRLSDARAEQQQPITAGPSSPLPSSDHASSERPIERPIERPMPAQPLAVNPVAAGWPAFPPPQLPPLPDNVQEQQDSDPRPAWTRSILTAWE